MHTTQNITSSTSIQDATWFWEIVYYFAPLYMHVAIASLMVNIFALAMPLFVMNVYDRIVPNSAFESLFVLAVGVFTVFILDFILRNARSYFVEFAGRNADVLLLGRFIDSISSTRLDAMPSASLGTFLTKVREFEYVRDFMGATTLIAVLDLPFILLFILLIGFLGGWLVLVPLCALPTLFLFSWIVQRKFENTTENQLQAISQKNALLGEIAAGFETIRATRLDTAFSKRWDLVVDKAALNNAHAKLVGVRAGHTNILINSIFSIILVIYGVYLIDAGTMSMGSLIACVILLGRMLAPLATLVNVASNFHKAKLGLISMHKLLQLPKEGGEEEKAHSIFKNNITQELVQNEYTTEEPIQENIEQEVNLELVEKTSFHSQKFISPILPLKASHTDIIFDNVSFKYPNTNAQNFSLSHINLKIRKGERIGIIGKTGSGKSSLAKLIAGLYLPTEGRTFYGNTEYASAPMRLIRQNMGILPQQVVLFSGTIRTNICDAWPTHIPFTESALMKICTIAGVMDFATKHPLGIDMPINEHGVGLSGGQAQAIALARALTGDPEILILDEPSSNLDLESEKQLILRLNQYLGHKTIIILTHRTTLLQLIDRLVVMEEGRITKDVPLRQTPIQPTSKEQELRS